MANARRLTPRMLRQMVLAEKKKVLESFGPEEPVEKAAKDTEEVDAEDMADTLEKDIDWMKALKIEESKLRSKLRRVNGAKSQLRRRIIKNLI
jgi:hypothetical protein